MVPVRLVVDGTGAEYILAFPCSAGCIGYGRWTGFCYPAVEWDVLRDDVHLQLQPQKATSATDMARLLDCGILLSRESLQDAEWPRK